MVKAKPERLHDRDVAFAGGRQERDGVDTGIGAPPLDQVREVGKKLGHRVWRLQGVTLGGGCDDRLCPSVEAVAILRRDAQVVGHDHAGQRLEDLRDTSPPPRSRSLSIRSTTKARTAGSTSRT